MASRFQHLSDYDPERVPDASGLRFAIVVSEWNTLITEKLREGVYETLTKHGAKPENILTAYVPGSFELIYAAERIASGSKVDAVIGLGCVVRGETPHFDYVCSAVTQGFAALNAKGEIPYIFGILTTNDMQQAIDRAGGKYGNKGDECAIAAIKMAHLAGLFK
ncbi:MAG: 6,7-dimethyl-8-ribityllumazine synthase [Dysgonamonadaceae bacterium]|jgi:6,7-dimethyl-8-ribityllumazine synthase|nr:6,7-dimethyl-8-ribityllumazine synthase [Dysgonamonadaceae bacterium]